MSAPDTADRLGQYYRWHSHVYDLTRWAFLFGRSELVQSVARSGPSRRILEIGCGTGTNLAALARAFPEAQLTGVDLSADMLAKAHVKLARFGPRVNLIEGAYREPLSNGEPFDLIVFSYCLTMINPGFAVVLRLCQRDLAPAGRIAIVDFHDTPFGWFRHWMGLNHVRMDGQILDCLREEGLTVRHCQERAAYAGLWRWITCVAEPHSSRV